MSPEPGRAARWQQVAANPDVPVLIIGGGINGAGLLRELALQGITAFLVEKGDFCSGASAASSRLVHGGLRYLEYGEFRLVREALRERNDLLRCAPHYVHPLAVTIPIFDWVGGVWPVIGKFLGGRGRPSSRGALLVKAGLTIYDWATHRSSALPAHHFASRAQALDAHPSLNPGIVCAASYHDAWVSSPERLGLELILDATGAGATALNYASVSAMREGWVMLRDEITGDEHRVRPQVAVNATGAWIDLTNRLLEAPTTLMGGTKGSHLVLRHPGLMAALGGRMIFFENADGRICLLLPFHDSVIAGTTDIPFSGPPDQAFCEAAEIDYILTSIRGVLPTIGVSRADIVSTYCGVRPLPRSPAAAHAGEISRDHFCPVSEPESGRPFPTFSLGGGKWTTFRAFAEQTADRILVRLGVKRRASSSGLPIGGGHDFPAPGEARDRWLAEAHRETGVRPDRMARLLDRYGTRSLDVARFIGAQLDREIEETAGYSAREIEFIVRFEHVSRLADIVFRRTSLALLGALTPGGLEEIANIAASSLRWSAPRRTAEIDQVGGALARHGCAPWHQPDSS